MDLQLLLSQLRRSFKVKPEDSLPGPLPKDGERATTIPLDRPLTEEERSIAEWLLVHAIPPALDFLPQLAIARVKGQCSCGCPTVDLRVPEETERAEQHDNPIGDVVGEVNGYTVGVMLLQRGGHLTCLEVYDLSDIERPYGLPDINSLRLFEGRGAQT